MESCWHAEPTKRPGFDALVACLELMLQPWLGRAPALTGPCRQLSNISSVAEGSGAAASSRALVTLSPAASASTGGATSRGGLAFSGTAAGRPGAPAAAGATAKAVAATPAALLPQGAAGAVAARWPAASARSGRGLTPAAVRRLSIDSAGARAAAPPKSRFIGSWD
jgi:hypothetical protein